MKEYLPYLVSLVTTAIGLGIWRYQLMAKRRFEVIERALIGADDAVRALHHIRDAESDAAKMARIVVDSPRPDRWLSTYQRIQEHSVTFEELQAITRLVTMHFGEDSGREFTKLLQLHKQICDAHAALYHRGYAEKLYPSVPYEQGVEEWKSVVSSDGENDRLTTQITDIGKKISERFAKYMRPTGLSLFLPI